MSEIEAGSVVQLKSRGPHMTVTSYGEKWDSRENRMVEDTSQIMCQWFDEKRALAYATFPAISLRIIPTSN